MNQLLTGIDALLVTNPQNIRYLTTFAGAAPNEREAYVLVFPNETHLFVNPLYIEQTKNLTSNSLKVIEVSREYQLREALQSAIKKYNVKHFGVESDNLTYAEYKNLETQLTNVNFIATSNRVENLRKIKREDEIGNIRKACKLGDECFEYIVKQIKVGITETELAAEIEYFFKKRGAESAFSPIVAFNGNASQPHYSPTNNTQLTTNNLILLDFGAKVHGYHGDMTRMVFFGTPPEEITTAYIALKDAQQLALDLLKRGERSGANLDQAVRDKLKESRFPSYPHSLGHGVGLNIHEAPRLSIKHDEVLKPDMVVTVEPGIYKEGSWGMRVEDTIMITKNTIEVLTNTTKILHRT